MDQATPIYLVGGPVRDALLGRPVKDLDFSVEGDAPALARLLGDELSGKTVVYRRFGTATVTLGADRVDLVTARSETYAQPGALPRVTPSGIEDDLARRDFSINALAIPLAGESTGNSTEVLDHCRGIEDLRLGVVRVLHPSSFIDDPTRIFRAVRYEQRLGFRIEDETIGLLTEALEAGHASALSPDRLRHELERILNEDDPGPILRRCIELGVWAAVHPSLIHADGLDRLEQRSAEIGPDSAVDRSLVYLAALVSDLPGNSAEELASRLNMTEAWRRVVRDSLALREMSDELENDSLPPSKLVRLLDDLSIEAVIALSLTSEHDKLSQRLNHYLTELRHVEAGLNGQELSELGVPPGPLIGHILARLRDDVLDGAPANDAGRRQAVKEMMAEATRDAGAIGNIVHE